MIYIALSLLILLLILMIDTPSNENMCLCTQTADGPEGIAIDWNARQKRIANCDYPSQFTAVV